MVLKHPISSANTFLQKVEYFKRNKATKNYFAVITQYSLRKTLILETQKHHCIIAFLINNVILRLIIFVDNLTWCHHRFLVTIKGMTQISQRFISKPQRVEYKKKFS